MYLSSHSFSLIALPESCGNGALILKICQMHGQHISRLGNVACIALIASQSHVIAVKSKTLASTFIGVIRSKLSSLEEPKIILDGCKFGFHIVIL